MTGVPQADLGPVKQLELRWRPGTVDDVAPRPTDVQQLMWLKVRPKGQPEAVVLDAMFRMQAAGRQIDEVKLRVDSRLRLLAEQSPAFEWVEEPAVDSDDGLVTIRWREPGKTATRSYACNFTSPTPRGWGTCHCHVSNSSTDASRSAGWP